MVPHSSNVTPEVQRLTKAFAKYRFFFETCCEYIKALPDKSLQLELYNEAVEKWRSRWEFSQPSEDDETARARFFYAVDEACKIESRTPEDCFLIIFASSAGMRTLVDQDLEKVSNSDRQYIVDESRRLSDQLTANMNLPPTSNSKANVQPLLIRPLKPEPEKLIHKQVYYQDPKSRKTRECIVKDQITSYFGGTYYVITDSENQDYEVNEEEMLDMLDKLVL